MFTSEAVCWAQFTNLDLTFAGQERTQTLLDVRVDTRKRQEGHQVEITTVPMFRKKSAREALADSVYKRSCERAPFVE
jgi:hypothetical protein